MTYAWLGPQVRCPIVELHEAAPRQLAALARPGIADFGRYRGASGSELALRGYPSLAGRVKTLTALLPQPGSVILARAITPAEGLRRGVRAVSLLVSELRFVEQIGSYHLWLRLLLRKAGLDPLAAFATLEAINDVPAMPVVRDRTHHIALLPAGGPPPPLPAELANMLRFPPTVFTHVPAPALVS